VSDVSLQNHIRAKAHLKSTYQIKDLPLDFS